MDVRRLGGPGRPLVCDDGASPSALASNLRTLASGPVPTEPRCDALSRRQRLLGLPGLAHGEDVPTTTDEQARRRPERCGGRPRKASRDDADAATATSGATRTHGRKRSRRRGPYVARPTSVAIRHLAASFPVRSGIATLESFTFVSRNSRSPSPSPRPGLDVADETCRVPGHRKDVQCGTCPRLSHAYLATSAHSPGRSCLLDRRLVAARRYRFGGLAKNRTRRQRSEDPERLPQDRRKHL